MAIALLRSQDCLKSTSSPSKIHSKPKSNNPNPSTPKRRNRCASDNEGGWRSKSLVVKAPAKNLIMGQVTILKRGEDLKVPVTDQQKKVVVPLKEQHKEEKLKTVKPKKDRKPKEERFNKVLDDGELELFSANRFGPEPDKVPKKINLKKDENFAGSAFIDSPSPRSLPLPGFFARKDTSRSESESNDATNGLRRLLRLDVM